MGRTIRVCGVWLADDPKLIVHEVLQDDSGRSLGVHVHANLALGLAVGLVDGPGGALVNSVHFNGRLPFTATAKMGTRVAQAMLWLLSESWLTRCFAAVANQPQGESEQMHLSCLCAAPGPCTGLSQIEAWCLTNDASEGPATSETLQLHVLLWIQI